MMDVAGGGARQTGATFAACRVIFHYNQPPRKSWMEKKNYASIRPLRPNPSLPHRSSSHAHTRLSHGLARGSQAVEARAKGDVSGRTRCQAVRAQCRWVSPTATKTKPPYRQ